MKVIERSLAVLPQSAVRIASSMETAATTVTEQGKGFAGDVVSCANSLKADVKAIADQIAAIPAMIDPQPVLDCCTEAIHKATSDLRKLGLDAAAIPQRLLEQVATVQQVVDEATRTAKSLPGTIPALSKLVPDFDSQLSFFHSLPARGDALAAQARRTTDMFEHYGRQLAPLSAQLAEMGSQAVTTQAKALQSDTLAQVQALRGILQTNVADLTSGVDDASAKASVMISGAASLVGKTGADLLAPLQAQIAFVERMQNALRTEAAACDALFDDGAAQLGRVGDIVLKPMAEARARIDAVIDQLEAAASNADTMLHKVLQPMDSLEVRADAIKQALDDVISVVGEEILQIQGLLAELDADAEKAKIALIALPDNFAPVRTKIAEAVALLEEIKGRIPGFVASANQALDGASTELDQAEDLCNRAIEVCTRYMMKSPPLMVARTLFMGVKTMIPTAQTAIATARKSVDAAGKQASGLLDLGISAVEALHPLLDQAIAQLKMAIDALVTLLVKLQAALQQISGMAGAIPPELSKQLEGAATAMHDVLNKVRASVNACLAKLECETLVQRLQQELTALLDQTVATVDQKIREASAPLQKALQQGREAVGQAAELAQEGLRTLHSALTSAHVQAQQPIDQLTQMMMSWQTRITSLSSSAKQQISQAEMKVLSLTDQVTQKISALTIEIPDLPLEVQSTIRKFSAFSAQIPTDVRTTVSDAGSLNDWQAKAQQCHEVIAGSIDRASAEVTQGLTEVRAASDNLRAEAQSACDAAVNIEATATELETSLTRMKAEAQAVADSAGEALDEMDASLQEASVEAESVVDHYAPVSEQLLTESQAQFDSATAIAEDAKEAEQGLAAEIAAAENYVGQAAQNATAQTEAFKDEAQAGIDATLVEVQAVQAQVEVARADVIAAEAIVDAEVVKHGGESTVVEPAENSDDAKGNTENNNKDNKQNNKQDSESSESSENGADAAAGTTTNAASSDAATSDDATASAAAASKTTQSDSATTSTAQADGVQPETNAPASSVLQGDGSAAGEGKADKADKADSGNQANKSKQSGAPFNEAVADPMSGEPAVRGEVESGSSPQSDKPRKKAALASPSDPASDRLPVQDAALDLNAEPENDEAGAIENDDPNGLNKRPSRQALPKEGDVKKSGGAPAKKPFSATMDALPAEGKDGELAAIDANRIGVAAATELAAQEPAIESAGAGTTAPFDTLTSAADKQATLTTDSKVPQAQDIALENIVPASVGPEDGLIKKASAPDPAIPKTSASEETIDSVVSSSETPVATAQESATGLVKGPAKPTLTGIGTSGPPVIIAKDTETAVKEALRARVTDAAGKELV